MGDERSGYYKVCDEYEENTCFLLSLLFVQKKWFARILSQIKINRYWVELYVIFAYLTLLFVNLNRFWIIYIDFPPTTLIGESQRIPLIMQSIL